MQTIINVARARHRRARHVYVGKEGRASLKALKVI
jgi:hypothetical protein